MLESSQIDCLSPSRLERHLESHRLERHIRVPKKTQKYPYSLFNFLLLILSFPLVDGEDNAENINEAKDWDFSLPLAEILFLRFLLLPPALDDLKYC